MSRHVLTTRSAACTAACYHWLGALYRCTLVAADIALFILNPLMMLLYMCQTKLKNQNYNPTLVPNKREKLLASSDLIFHTYQHTITLLAKMNNPYGAGKSSKCKRDTLKTYPVRHPSRNMARLLVASDKKQPNFQANKPGAEMHRHQKTKTKKAPQTHHKNSPRQATSFQFSSSYSPSLSPINANVSRTKSCPLERSQQKMTSGRTG